MNPQPPDHTSICRGSRFCIESLLRLSLLGVLAPGLASAQNAPGPDLKTATTWIETFPEELRSSILWYADYETGDLSQWSMPESKDPGGGVFNTDEENVIARATQTVAHSGKFAAEATIKNAFRAKNGNKAVRLMRWATEAFDRGGKELPPEAYYSTWMYLPEAYDPTKQAPWDPGDGGWWIVFQFKSHDEQNESHPVWMLNVAKHPHNGQLSFYFYSPINRQKSWKPKLHRPLPIGRWFHVETFVRISEAPRGRISLWLDGELILEAEGVKTSLNPQRENLVWGIGSYTDHIGGGSKPGTATIYFDDSLMSSRSLAPFVKQFLRK
jgi:hypothetical protein